MCIRDRHFAYYTGAAVHLSPCVLQSEEHGARGVRPVSYTHLDVYKRQEEGTSVKLTVRRYGRDITVTCERRQVNRVYVSNKTMADGVEYICLLYTSAAD